MIQSYKQEISPDVAKQYIRTNNQNRPLRKRRVDYYAKLMERGKWKLTHQGIAFDKNGVMIDGNHRMHAVVQSGLTMPFMVTHGIDHDTFDVVDVGYKRTAGNIFAIHGVKNYQEHASGIPRYMRMATTSSHRQGASGFRISDFGAFTYGDFYDFYRENAGFLDVVSNDCTRYYKQYKILTKSTIYAYYCFLYFEKNHAKPIIDDFFNSLYMFTHSARSNSPTLLFRILMKHHAGDKVLSKEEQEAYFVIAWNNFIDRKTTKSLVKRKGTFPKLK